MRPLRRIVAALLFVAASALANYREYTDVPRDPSLDTKLRRAAEASLAQFPNLKADDLALSLVDVTHADTMGRGDYHGDAPFYPASVIKLFFMVDTYAQQKQNLPDVGRALKEMIGVSDNDATAFIVDILTDTTSGPQLQGRALRKFTERRKVVTKFFTGMGYDVNAMMKPWSFGPYGRDAQLVFPDKRYRNRTTANAVASLLLWIVRRRAVSPEASEAMMTLLSRPLDEPPGEGNQTREFIGGALPAGARLWSKAGWTSEVRHDAAYVELPGGRKLILVIYTRGHAADTTLLPAITRNVLAELQ